MYTIKAIENNKSAGSSSIVGELIKYGGKRMCKMFVDIV